jgi:hypothetical protein
MSADPMPNGTPHEEPQLATLPAPAGPADATVLAEGGQPVTA